MKKSELLKLRPQYATPTMMRSAVNDTPRSIKTWSSEKVDVYKKKLYMRGKYDNGIVRIAIFLTENMRLGSKKPSFEIFIDTENRDFITYDYKHSKWSNAKINLLPFPRYCCYGKAYSGRNFNAFIQRHLHTKDTGADGIYEWQEGVRTEQLKERHKKETDPWDEKMNKVAAEPADWRRWVDKCGIPENFIFYNYVKGGAKTGYCTWCEKTVEIKNPRHNAFGKCSCCGHDIQYKAIGKAGTVMTKRVNVYLPQKYEDGFIFRQYTAYKKYPKGNYTKPELYIIEDVRVLLDSSLNSERYYHGDYKHECYRWIYNGSELRYSWYYNYAWLGRVYKRTMPSLRKLLQRTGLFEMVYQLQEIDPEVYLSALREKPYIEQLAKAGLTQLVSDIVFERRRDYGFNIDTSNELGKALHIDRGRLQRLRKNNGGTLFLEWLKFEKVHNKHIDDDVIAWMDKEHIEPKDINFISDRMSERQVKNYLVRQQRELQLPIREIISTWSDYLKMAMRAKMNVNDEIVFRAKKLKQRHDELVELLGSKELALRAGEIAMKFPNVDSVCKEIKGKYEFENETYAVIAPKSIEDILNEGQMLHHCIGSTDRYFERIHTRESFLLFLRKKEDISKPWYTLEVEPDGTIRQKRTEYDRQNKDLKDAEPFLMAWQKFVQKNISKDDLKLAEVSRNLRVKEFEEMRENNVKISHGHLAGHSLADVLEADLMENMNVGRIA